MIQTWIQCVLPTLGAFWTRISETFYGTAYGQIKLRIKFRKEDKLWKLNLRSPWRVPTNPATCVQLHLSVSWVFPIALRVVITSKNKWEAWCGIFGKCGSHGVRTLCHIEQRPSQVFHPPFSPKFLCWHLCGPLSSVCDSLCWFCPPTWLQLRSSCLRCLGRLFIRKSSSAPWSCMGAPVSHDIKHTLDTGLLAKNTILFLCPSNAQPRIRSHSSYARQFFLLIFVLNSCS